MTTEELKQKQATLFWWMSPRKDNHYQWWWGYQRVRMNVLPDCEKQAYIRKQNDNNN